MVSIFSSSLVEMIQFDLRIFFRWVGSSTTKSLTHIAVFFLFFHGFISVENFGKVGCTVLAEAAIMTGLRQLLPHLLASFQVPTGLEGQKVVVLSFEACQVI